MNNNLENKYPKVIVIVVTYNGLNWIETCFRSLLHSTIPLKILAIDNASTDGTPNIVRAKFPTVEVIETGQNLGFGKANNIGLKRVMDENAEYAFLLNQDAWIENDTLEKLIFAHQQNPNMGILSPIEYYSENVLDRKFRVFYAPKELLNNLNISKIHSTKFINAAGWLIPRKTLETIGYFDPIFNHYGEDVDYCNRVLHFNYEIGILGNCNYYHKRPQKLTHEIALAKQAYHFLIKQMLFLRWSELSQLTTKWIIIKETALFQLKLGRHKDFKTMLIVSKGFIKLLFNIKEIRTIKKCSSP